MVKLYFAGVDCYPDPFKDGKYGTLISYYSIKNKTPPLSNIFLDSGAFTAFTQNKIIDLNAYIQYIKKYQNYFEVVAALDVIGNPEQSYANWIAMKNAGVDAIPTFHLQSPFKWLRRLIDETDHFALGGMVPYSSEPAYLRAWLSKCFSMIPEDKKVHGFGLSNWKLVKQFPFHSVDSTSWLWGGRRGILYQYDKGRLKQVVSKTVAVGTNDWKKAHEWNIVQWKKFADHIQRQKHTP